MTKRKPPSLKAKDRSTTWELEFLRAVSGYAQAVCNERGTVLKSMKLAPGCVNIVRELRNDEDFTFLLDTNQTALGDNKLKLWHHPGRRFYEGLEPALVVEWYLSIEATTIPKVRSRHPTWQAKIRQLIKRRDDLMLVTESEPTAFPPGIVGRRIHRAA